MNHLSNRNPNVAPSGTYPSSIKIMAVAGSALIWISMWYLIEAALQNLSQTKQVLAYIAVLLIGVKVLDTVASSGYDF